MLSLLSKAAPLRRQAFATALRAFAAQPASAPGSAGRPLNKSLEETDPELFEVMEREKQRQRNSLALIPSENFTSRAVLDALGSVMSNKYSEGYPNARYYGGNEFIDMAEDMCRNRALTAFKADPAKWGVNVQTLSGSPANFAVFSAVCKPHDRIMGLDLPHGGHLSHGFQTDTKKVRPALTPLHFSPRLAAATPRPTPPHPSPPHPAPSQDLDGLRVFRDDALPSG